MWCGALELLREWKKESPFCTGINVTFTSYFSMACLTPKLFHNRMFFELIDIFYSQNDIRNSQSQTQSKKIPSF